MVNSETLEEWSRAKREWEKWKVVSLNIAVPKVYVTELEKVVAEIKKRNPRMNRSRFVVEAIVKYIKEVKKSLGLSKKEKI